jgi:mRNA interferase RelE/StbE
MEVIADKSFERDFKKLSPKMKQLTAVIYETLVQAKQLSDVLKLKKMSGHKNYYRIKIDDYRLGVYVIKNVVYLSRILARKDIYKFFPPK